jgi:hypothetical protein
LVLVGYSLIGIASMTAFQKRTIEMKYVFVLAAIACLGTISILYAEVNKKTNGEHTVQTSAFYSVGLFLLVVANSLCSRVGVKYLK